MQELKGALSRAEAEKSSLRETMVQTETLIKQARHEHEQEISEASEAAAAECEALQQKCNDLQLAVCFSQQACMCCLHRVQFLYVAYSMNNVCHQLSTGKQL